ncbi:fructose bisphosphate aldolase [Demequina sp. TTPB684]|uniref:fructose bisphosphate aldolase n=1 Tax=unclassified Demequina TaxID=2620311 RepID=UPI001CF49F7C|nr:MULTISPECIES: fructose bisphosphate aldolase [unclassified Demequina]MCB2413058.1 fructose bisphosphate aldolase [Demequina sp. TTPB684]UPU88133.1 fructose bisphosphate aldolase [Demequina sp. TMPB413]
MDTEKLEKIKNGKGFIAALDQSGGSTPKALKLYGIDEHAYANEAEMYDLIHQMRARIMTSPAFTGEHILGAILFEMTLEREVGGKGAAEYLWENKRIVPFLKVDKGLAEAADGVRTMNPLPDLEEVLERAKTHGVFGTKMRSVIRLANKAGVQAVVDQQFQVARRIIEADLVPIIEPEVDVFSPEKALAEIMLRSALLEALDQLDPSQQVMLKVSLPEQSDLHADLVAHPNVLRVVALSGGYTRENANFRLARNHGVVASFSRALTEGLTVRQSQEVFDAELHDSVTSIYEASMT